LKYFNKSGFARIQLDPRIGLEMKRNAHCLFDNTQSHRRAARSCGPVQKSGYGDWLFKTNRLIKQSARSIGPFIRGA
jgi:hypothetical protein